MNTAALTFGFTLTDSTYTGFLEYLPMIFPNDKTQQLSAARAILERRKQQITETLEELNIQTKEQEDIEELNIQTEEHRVVEHRATEPQVIEEQEPNHTIQASSPEPKPNLSKQELALKVSILSVGLVTSLSGATSKHVLYEIGRRYLSKGRWCYRAKYAWNTLVEDPSVLLQLKDQLERLLEALEQLIQAFDVESGPTP